MVKKKGLGRGLDLLIPETNTDKGKSAETIDEFMMADINMVEPNRNQPRKKFDEDGLLELAESIGKNGVVQPLIVQKRNGYFEIVAGERRWRAAKKAGLREIPVIVKDFTTQQIVEISLIENIQRENLNPIEEAMAYKRLLEEFHLKQDEVAERVSKSRTAVTNSMRLLKLHERVQQMIIDEMISTGHGRALLAIEDSETQIDLACRVYDEKLSVREIEKIVKQIKNPKAPKQKRSEERNENFQEIEDRMKEIMGTKVRIKPLGNEKGKIEIEYGSPSELERMFDMIMSLERDDE